MSEMTKKANSEPGYRRLIAAGAAVAVLALGACGTASEKEKNVNRATVVEELATTLSGLESRLKPFRVDKSNGETDKRFYSVPPRPNPENNATESWGKGITPGSLTVHSDGSTKTYEIGRVYEGMPLDRVEVTVSISDNSIESFTIPTAEASDFTSSYTGHLLKELPSDEASRIDKSFATTNNILGSFQAPPVYIPAN